MGRIIIQMLKIIWIITGMLSIVLSGCGKQETYPEFLTEKIWIYENMICTQRMCFSDNGEYMFNCACGEPVGNSDMYDSYSYNTETNIILLYPCEKGLDTRQIEVVARDEGSLLLKVDGEVKEFYADSYVPVLSEYTDYLEDYSAYRSLFEMEDGEWTTGPSDYDGDIAEDRDRLRKDKVASDVEFYELYIETIESEDGTSSTHTYRKLSEEEVLYNPDNSFDSGFIWYNENIEIEKVLIYGETITFE